MILPVAILGLLLAQAPVPTDLKAGPCVEVPYDGTLLPSQTAKECRACLRTVELEGAAPIPEPSKDPVVTTFWVVGTGVAIIAAFAGGVVLGVEASK